MKINIMILFFDCLMNSRQCEALLKAEGKSMFNKSGDLMLTSVSFSRLFHTQAYGTEMAEDSPSTMSG